VRELSDYAKEVETKLHEAHDLIDALSVEVRELRERVGATALDPSKIVEALVLAPKHLTDDAIERLADAYASELVQRRGHPSSS
jgi:hypothetical protein